MASWILPKNERWGNFQYIKLPQRSFFGGIKDNIFFFRDFLTFNKLLLIFSPITEFQSILIPAYFLSNQIKTNSSKLKFFGQNWTKIELIDWVLLFASPITQFQSILFTFYMLPKQNKPSKLKLFGHNWTKIEVLLAIIQKI